MSIGRANISGRQRRSQAGDQSPGPGRPAPGERARMSITGALREPQRAISWPADEHRERERECKKSGSEMKAVSEKLSLL